MHSHEPYVRIIAFVNVVVVFLVCIHECTAHLLSRKHPSEASDATPPQKTPRLIPKNGMKFGVRSANLIRFQFRVAAGWIQIQQVGRASASFFCSSFAYSDASEKTMLV